MKWLVSFDFRVIESHKLIIFVSFDGWWLNLD